MQFVCYGFDKSHKYLGKLFSLVKSFPKPVQAFKNILKVF